MASGNCKYTRYHNLSEVYQLMGTAICQHIIVCTRRREAIVMVSAFT